MNKNKTKVKLDFTDEQLTKFDNAVDLAFSKGYQIEKLFQPPKMVGDTLITYVVMRNLQDANQAYDVLVMMKLQGTNCEVSFNRPPKPGEFGLVPIPFKEFLALPDVE